MTNFKDAGRFGYEIAKWAIGFSIIFAPVAALANALTTLLVR